MEEWTVNETGGISRAFSCPADDIRKCSVRIIRRNGEPETITHTTVMLRRRENMVSGVCFLPGHDNDAGMWRQSWIESALSFASSRGFTIQSSGRQLPGRIVLIKFVGYTPATSAQQTEVPREETEILSWSSLGYVDELLAVNSLHFHDFSAVAVRVPGHSS